MASGTWRSAGSDTPDASFRSSGPVAPVTATTVRARARTAKPPCSSSMTVASASLPSSWLATRKAVASSAPDADTPWRACPGRPASWNSACRPVATTSKTCATAFSSPARQALCPSPPASSAAATEGARIASPQRESPSAAAVMQAPLTGVLRCCTTSRCSASPSSVATSTNCTRCPGCSSAGGVRIRSHIGTSVVPMSCHPPGVARGYTALKVPASPTEPAGMRVRGLTRRGTLNTGSPPDR